MFNSQVFDVPYGTGSYVIEFCREGLREADSLGVLNDSIGILDKLSIILYAGLKKNHPFMTPSKAKKILDDLLEEEDYDVSSFDEIIEEFNRCYKECFFGQAKKAKKFTARGKTTQ